MLRHGDGRKRMHASHSLCNMKTFLRVISQVHMIFMLHVPGHQLSSLPYQDAPACTQAPNEIQDRIPLLNIS